MEMRGRFPPKTTLLSLFSGIFPEIFLLFLGRFVVDFQRESFLFFFSENIPENKFF